MANEPFMGLGDHYWKSTGAGTNADPYIHSMDSDPASGAFAITPHDTNALAHNTRAIYVGVAGNVTLKTVNDETVQFVGLAAGTILPVRAKVVTTATTATSLVGLY